MRLHLIAIIIKGKPKENNNYLPANENLHDKNA